MQFVCDQFVCRREQDEGGNNGCDASKRRRENQRDTGDKEEDAKYPSEYEAKRDCSVFGGLLWCSHERRGERNRKEVWQHLMGAMVFSKGTLSGPSYSSSAEASEES